MRRPEVTGTLLRAVFFGRWNNSRGVARRNHAEPFTGANYNISKGRGSPQSPQSHVFYVRLPVSARGTNLLLLDIDQGAAYYERLLWSEKSSS
jgi:hypothetical protein